MQTVSRHKLDLKDIEDYSGVIPFPSSPLPLSLPPRFPADALVTTT